MPTILEITGHHKTQSARYAESSSLALRLYTDRDCAASRTASDCMVDCVGVEDVINDALRCTTVISARFYHEYRKYTVFDMISSALSLFGGKIALIKCHLEAFLVSIDMFLYNGVYHSSIQIVHFRVGLFKQY